MFDDIRRQVEAEFSGERAKALTAAIHGYDRWSTFWQYGLCGAYCAARMRECGLEDVELMEIPADGETKFGDWAMPLAWDVEDATLEILEPEDSARMLAHYRQEPASLAMWSAPTPPEGTEAEVVLLEDGDKDGEYGEVDVKGKVVFASRHAGSVRKWASRRGALGVISDYPACSEDDLAEGVCWVNAWVDYHGWGFLKIDTPMFGFTLNREKGAYLRRLLANGGRVRVRAVVRSSLYEGRFTLPTGMIRGETDEEVVVYGHTYEYGAEDNASGCAAALEAARTLNKLIQAGKLPRPKRSIRFMMSWECYGSIPWCVERIYEKKNVVAGLCLDDMGAKRVLTGGQLTLVLNSHCAASFTDFAASEIAKACLREDEGYPLQISDWKGGTDHTIFQDPAFGVPMPWFTELSPRFHHTSLDTMDNIDGDSLKKEGIFAATYLYFVANAGERESAWLAEGTRRLWETRLGEAAKVCEKDFTGAHGAEGLEGAWSERRERIEYLLERGAAAIRSVRRLAESESVTLIVNKQIGQFEAVGAKALTELARAARDTAAAKQWAVSEQAERGPAGEGAELIPRRMLPGLLTLCTIPEETRSELDAITRGASPMWSAALIFALYWADGHRTVQDIDRRVRLEFGPTEIDLTAYFGLLHRLGYVEWASATLRNLGAKGTAVTGCPPKGAV